MQLFLKPWQKGSMILESLLSCMFFAHNPIAMHNFPIALPKKSCEATYKCIDWKSRSMGTASSGK